MRAKFLGLLVFVFVACVTSSVVADDKADAAKLKKQLVGKWANSDETKKGVLEFKKDGTLSVKVEVGDRKVEIGGKYEVKDAKKVEVEMSFMGQTMKQTIEIEIKKDVMTSKDKDGKVEKFKRVKEKKEK